MRTSRRERGQILPIVALALVAMLGVSAFAIDVGYAYYAKRQLQAATDAAALAGAQELPSVDAAKTKAADYASLNVPAELAPTTTFTYATKCTTNASPATCTATNPNALVVSGTTNTKTWFAKIFGWASFNVSAKANACSPCSSSPVDVVVVLDRTGSMCDDTDKKGCVDLNNAKDGVHTLLKMLNPPYAQVGMIAFPPLMDPDADPCDAPQGTSSDYTAYDYDDSKYVTDTIRSDYKTAQGADNLSSGLYLHTVEGNDTKCVIPDGYTSYSEALRQAKIELDAHGRANVPDVIVFLTDGEANIGSVYASDGHSYQDKKGSGVYGSAAFPDNSAYPPENDDDQRPCQTAVDLADDYKDDGVTIYSIGYALGDNKRCTAGDYGPWIPKQAAIKKDGKTTQVAIPAHWCDRDSEAKVEIDDKTYTENTRCRHKSDDHNESPAIYSDDTVEDIASDGAFYDRSAGGDLSSTFAAIATDIGAGSSRLVDDSY